MSEECSAENDAGLRAVAEAADNGGRAWEWSGGYPQQVIRQGDAMLVAETYEGPDFPSTIAEFIATFDPPTVLALLDELRANRRVARDAVAAKETAPCTYDLPANLGDPWRCAECGSRRDAHFAGERDGTISHAWQPTLPFNGEKGQS